MNKVAKFLISFGVFVVICAVALNWFVHSEVRKELDRTVAETPGLQVSYTDLSVDIYDHAVTLEDVAVTLPSGQTFTADALCISDFDQRNPIPHHARATASRLSCDVTTANFGAWADIMRKSGIESIVGHGVVDYIYDPDTKIFTLKTLSLDDQKLGRATLNCAVTGIDLNAIRLEQLIGFSLKNATLQLTDRSLTHTVVAHWSHVMKTSETQTVSLIRRELAGLAEIAAKQENMVAEDVMLGLRRFMGDPASMTVSLAPNKPVPVLYFFMGRDIFETMQLLNMKIVTNSSDGI
ncbi:hypothetical protein GO013_05470 [Pseudodesulfovibrio sp. JC047]|uniref:hypothetical protein n=1 Tax=Pseudodesulfovibrio sp. JC047 TaxID=2683199 RepID=UPI0013D3F61C|nr:hypothetical protein [Pseudodesulfovibrio sp. JC047]NDV18867.1 hypothetical protein [Pseudodesulfovibrio sp. JC047]